MLIQVIKIAPPNIEASLYNIGWAKIPNMLEESEINFTAFILGVSAPLYIHLEFFSLEVQYFKYEVVIEGI